MIVKDNKRQFKRKSISKKILKGILIAISVIVVIIVICLLTMNLSIGFRIIIGIIGRYFAIMFVVSSVTIIFYHFICIFCKKKWLKYLITAIILSLCLFWYIESKKEPKIVRMKEDILYIKPMEKE